MGLERCIRFPPDREPAWDAIRGLLNRIGVDCSIRMIDGLPAFPNEVPEPGWRELRLGLAGGMVTVRSGEGTLTCVVWSNVDDAVRAGWDAVCWACAAATDGVVETATGSASPDEFARTTGITC